MGNVVAHHSRLYAQLSGNLYVTPLFQAIEKERTSTLWRQFQKSDLECSNVFATHDVTIRRPTVDRRLDELLALQSEPVGTLLGTVDSDIRGRLEQKGAQESDRAWLGELQHAHVSLLGYIVSFAFVTQPGHQKRVQGTIVFLNEVCHRLPVGRRTHTLPYLIRGVRRSFF